MAKFAVNSRLVAHAIHPTTKKHLFLAAHAANSAANKPEEKSFRRRNFHLELENSEASCFRAKTPLEKSCFFGGTAWRGRALLAGRSPTLWPPLGWMGGHLAPHPTPSCARRPHTLGRVVKERQRCVPCTQRASAAAADAAAHNAATAINASGVMSRCPVGHVSERKTDQCELSPCEFVFLRK